jgi:septation ring formation regulator EzrA
MKDVIDHLDIGQEPTDLAQSFYEVLEREAMADKTVYQRVHEASRNIRKQRAAESYSTRA